MSDYPIVFDNVYRRFDDHVVLNGLSFRVEPGTVYALLGRNGSGKTTAIRTLLGFLTPHHGAAHICARDSTRLRPQDRARIGYVTEGHRLYGIMTIQSILEFENGTRPDFELPKALDAVRRFGLRPKQRIRSLSRGQRAQVALICAMAASPEVLIFDDPALGLDVVMRREFLDVMIEMLSDRGCTVLLSSHILTEVERIADRVGILHDGALIVDATLDDLKRRLQRRTWKSDLGEAPPRVPGVLSVSTRSGGHELTLLDCNDALIERLEAQGELGEPAVPTLEELFVDLVGNASAGVRAPAAPEPVQA